MNASDRMSDRHWTAAEAEALVKRIYSPMPGSLVGDLNEQALQLQHSPGAWGLADELMASDDKSVRTWAANTFIVKLNTAGSSLDVATAQNVQDRIIYWLVAASIQGEGRLICQKLCSALTAYFIRRIASPVPWQRPLLHVAISLSVGRPVPQDQAEESPVPITDVLQTLGDLQRKVLLWLAGALAEEVSKLSNRDPESARPHDQMAGIATDACTVMRQFLVARAEEEGSSARAVALQTFLTWVNYAQMHWSSHSNELILLRELVEPAAYRLLDDDVQTQALEIFQDLLESYSNFFTPAHLDGLRQIIQTYIGPNLLRGLEDQDPESLMLGRFIITFGVATIEQVVEQPTDRMRSAIVLELLYRMLSTDGCPGDEDQFSIDCIEFWNTYIEYVNDVIFEKEEDEKPGWLPHAKEVMSTAVKLHWKKMWTPSADVYRTWNDEEREGFTEFRRDASDLLSTAFHLLDHAMLRQLVSLILPLVGHEWRGVEAALFCFNKLADQVLEHESYEEIVGDIFRSSLFRLVADFSLDIPSQARGTAIEMLGRYGQYIAKHPEFIDDALGFLFTSLETLEFKNAAAKAIELFCSSCRGRLTDRLNGFLAQYQRFLSSGTSDRFTKANVIGAIATIVQALNPENAKVGPLMDLLAYVWKDVEACKEYAAVGDPENAQEMAVTALVCLESIGKGMQVPEDEPIDVDGAQSSVSLEGSFWDSGGGQVVQERIISCFSVLVVVGDDDEAIDAACKVLKTGFVEREPGPFVLPPRVTVQFLQQCSTTTKAVEDILGAARTLITQHSGRDTNRIDEEVKDIYEHVASFMETLGTSFTDESLATSILELLNKMMQRYAHVLFENIKPSTIDFTLTTFATAETFPKRQASEFWTKTIQLGTNTGSQTVKKRIQEIMTAFGRKLADALVRQISGVATRSDFESYSLCDPFIALWTMPEGRQVVQLSLMSDNVTAPQIDAQRRSMFLSQLSTARSDRKMIKGFVMKFWSECRGTVASY